MDRARFSFDSIKKKKKKKKKKEGKWRETIYVNPVISNIEIVSDT